MTELIYLLFNGPTLKASSEVVSDRKYETRYSLKHIPLYKSVSKDNKIWAQLITAIRPIKPQTASRQLRQMCHDGLLKEAGRLKGTRSTSPPYIYEWI